MSLGTNHAYILPSSILISLGRDFILPPKIILMDKRAFSRFKAPAGRILIETMTS